jgi:hypothetical protein
MLDSAQIVPNRKVVSGTCQLEVPTVNGIVCFKQQKKFKAILTIGDSNG